MTNFKKMYYKVKRINNRQYVAAKAYKGGFWIFSFDFNWRINNGIPLLKISNNEVKKSTEISSEDFQLEINKLKKNHIKTLLKRGYWGDAPSDIISELCFEDTFGVPIFKVKAARVHWPLKMIEVKTGGECRGIIIRNKDDSYYVKIKSELEAHEVFNSLIGLFEDEDISEGFYIDNKIEYEVYEL